MQDVIGRVISVELTETAHELSATVDYPSPHGRARSPIRALYNNGGSQEPKAFILERGRCTEILQGLPRINDYAFPSNKTDKLPSNMSLLATLSQMDRDDPPLTASGRPSGTGLPRPPITPTRLWKWPSPTPSRTRPKPLPAATTC
jgi:hypothetical protein